MTTELFEGNPDNLKLRLQTIIGGGGVIHSVTPTHQKAKYIILWT